MDIIENKDTENKDTKNNRESSIELIEYVVEEKYDEYLYTGYWKNKKPHKYGQLFKDDRLMYDGEFLNGEYHGYGISYKYYGDIELSEYYKGRFFKGFLQGEFTGYWLSTNKKYLEADFNKSHIHGFVTYYHKNELIRATGMKTNQQYVGEWTFYYPTGKLHGKVSHIVNTICKGILYENDEKIEGVFDLSMTYYCIFRDSMKPCIVYATITNLAGNVYEIFNYGCNNYLLYMKSNDIICVIDKYEVIKPYMYETIISANDFCLPVFEYKMFVNNEWKQARVKRHVNVPFTYWTAEVVNNLNSNQTGNLNNNQDIESQNDEECY